MPSWSPTPGFRPLLSLAFTPILHRSSSQMVNFSSLIPKRRLSGTVLGRDERLGAFFINMVAFRTTVIEGEDCDRAITGNLLAQMNNTFGCEAKFSNCVQLPKQKGNGRDILGRKGVAEICHNLRVANPSGLGVLGFQNMRYSFSSVVEAPLSGKNHENDSVAKQATIKYAKPNSEGMLKLQIGENVSKKDKMKFLVNTLLDIKDSKEAVYGVLDAWVAWEQNFPISSLKRVLSILEKEQQWHRVIQVIKWMLSKGQGNTRGTYGQLIRALDKDHRAEEAHKVWLKKIGSDLHSVPWQLCRQMIGIYYRNNMLEELTKLFKGLESFDRKPPEKALVQRVADAYEMLGLLEEKERVLEKYGDLFTEGSSLKKSRSSSSKKNKKSGKVRDGTASANLLTSNESLRDGATSANRSTKIESLHEP